MNDKLLYEINVYNLFHTLLLIEYMLAKRFQYLKFRYYLFKNLKTFLRGKNFGYDDQVITTVEEYLSNLPNRSRYDFDSKQSQFCLLSGGNL